MAIVGRSVPNVPIVRRGTLVDDPVLTTPKPIVVATPTRPRAAVVIVGRSSLVDVVASTDPTPGPVVVVPRGRARAGSVIVARAHLADDPVLTSPPPLVVTPAPRQRRAFVATSRGSLFDAATRGPIVVTPAPVVRRNPPVLVFRNPAADTPESPGRPPLVIVGAPRRRPGGSVILLRTSLEGGAAPPTPGPGVTFTVSPPRARWAVGSPADRWNAGEPTDRWTVDPAGPDSTWTAGPPEV